MGLAFPVSFGSIPCFCVVIPFGGARGFGVATFFVIEAAFGASGGLDLLHAHVNWHKGAVDEPSQVCTSPNAGVAAGVSAGAGIAANFVAGACWPCHFLPSFPAHLLVVPCSWLTPVHFVLWA
jgi:hypothetical protein